MNPARAAENVADSVTKELLNRVRESPAASLNSALALAGLATSLPSSALSKIERVADSLREVLSSLLKDQELEMGVCGAAIGLGKHYSHLTRLVAIPDVHVGITSQALHATDTTRVDEIVASLQSGFTGTTTEWMKSVYHSL